MFSSSLSRREPEVVFHDLWERVLKLELRLRPQRLNHWIVLVFHHLLPQALPLSLELLFDYAFLRKQYVREGSETVVCKLLLDQPVCHVAYERQADAGALPSLEYLQHIRALQLVDKLKLLGGFLLDKRVLVAFVQQIRMLAKLPSDEDSVFCVKVLLICLQGVVFEYIGELDGLWVKGVSKHAGR